MTTGSARCARRSRRNFVERDDTIYDAGASVAVTLDGELVVDLWGGTVDTDADRDVPWERDTIVNVWSTTKTVSALACLVLADQRRARLLRPGGPVLARVQGRRQGGHPGPPRDEPHGRAGGLAGADHARGPVRLGEGDVAARRPGAVVGAGHGVRLPRPHAGLPRGRARAADHGADDRRVRRRRDDRSARRRLPHRHGSRARRPRRPTSSRPPVPLAVEGVGEDSIADAHVGQPAARRPRSANTTAWRRAEIPAAGGHGNARSVALCTPRWPAAARPTAYGCCRRRASSRCSTSSATAQDLVLPIGRAPRHRVRAAVARRCRSARTSGPASGVVGAARWRSSTSTPG